MAAWQPISGTQDRQRKDTVSAAKAIVESGCFRVEAGSQAGQLGTRQQHSGPTKKGHSLSRKRLRQKRLLKGAWATPMKLLVEAVVVGRAGSTKTLVGATPSLAPPRVVLGGPTGAGFLIMVLVERAAQRC